MPMTMMMTTMSLIRRLGEAAEAVAVERSLSTSLV